MRAILLATCLATLAAPAGAQTLLHLAASASVTRTPDQLTASLSAQATAATPQDAQAQVNRSAAAALASAGRTAGVTVATGGYRTWRLPPPQNGWQADQSIVLSAETTAAPALLALLGHLQQSGLATTDLTWSLSAAQLKSAQDQAMRQAITTLQGQAEQAASLLHLRFAGFRSIDLSPETGPRPMQLLATRAMQPSAVPADTEITATIDAQAILEDPSAKP